MKLTKRILGSILSVVVGWLVCTLVWAGGIAVISLSEGGVVQAVAAGLGFSVFVGAVCGVFALVAWLGAFVWIYLFLPDSSRLWVWWRAALFGAAVGVVVVAAPFVLLGDANFLSLLAFAPSAAVTGGTAAAFASITRPFFFKP
jgi:hypothetical protein